MGSEFTVKLPITRSYPSHHRARVNRLGNELENNTLYSTRVLIVEDDVDSLEMLKLVLESSGAVVTSVDRTQKAVEELTRHQFDVIISDLGLPEMDGHDLIREVRGPLGLDAVHLPAIALSGYAAEEDRQRSLASGFQLHLQKPLDISTLASTIKELLDQRDESPARG